MNKTEQFWADYVRGYMSAELYRVMGDDDAYKFLISERLFIIVAINPSSGITRVTIELNDYKISRDISRVTPEFQEAHLQGTIAKLVMQALPAIALILVGGKK